MAAGQWLTGADGVEVEWYWPNALDEVSVEDLSALLASARVQCEAFAPSLTRTLADGTTVTDPVPDNYRHAQALQARALFRTGLAGDNNGIGADGMTVTVFPLDWSIKALLRPKRGRLSVR